jgi:hypothetical protein
MVKAKLIKGQTVIYKTLHRKQKIEQYEQYKEQGVNSGAPGGGEYEISVILVTVFVFL